MLDIFKWEKQYYKLFLYFIKKNQTASPKNLHFLIKKNRTALVFMPE